MRDPRFIAAHRGGPLGREEHRLLALWAADCAGHLLPLLEKSSDDGRAQRAVEVGRAWARAEVPVGDAQKAAVACHALARELGCPAAVAVARAAGHAVATAHMADHSLGVVRYGLKAVEAAGGSPAEEEAWQLARLPARVRVLVVSGIARRFPRTEGSG